MCFAVDIGFRDTTNNLDPTTDEMVIVPVVANYETILSIAAPIEAAFAFVSDFRNAAKWDPRTYNARKTIDGPIGVGTRFVLTGGMMSESLINRLRLPVSVAGMALPYDVVEFDPPNEFVLAGESPILRWRDRLAFSEEGAGTRLHYFAELQFRGSLVIAEPLLRMMFRRIGDDATRELAATVIDGV